jgi:hypothetical protein
MKPLAAHRQVDKQWEKPFCIEAHCRPQAVAFDLVQPLAAGRQLIGFGWEARRDEPSSGWENLVARDQARPAGTPLVAR